jgi:hypothetical protein
MSLINDALKRAKEAQRNDIPSGVSPMRPVEANRRERDFHLVLPVVIVFLVVTAFILIGLAMIRHAVKITTNKTAVIPAIVPKQEIAAAALLVTNPPAPASSAPPAEVVRPVVTNLPAPRPLRIQGIAYDAAHPSAIIGGKAVYVGDWVDGMCVTAISPNSVTLAGNGQTNTLTVGQP